MTIPRIRWFDCLTCKERFMRQRTPKKCPRCKTEGNWYAEINGRKHREIEAE